MKARERNDIIISWVTISAAFALLLSQGFPNFLSPVFLFPIVALTVGAGFVLHEMCHRQLAIKYGARAEFVAWKRGLQLAILLGVISFFTPFGLVFAAPGAVYIFGPHITREQNGKISLAGPVSNIILAALFLLMLIAVRGEGLLGFIGYIGAYVNAFLAVFNLIPFPPLDGSKIMVWNPMIWGITMAIGLAMLFAI